MTVKYGFRRFVLFACFCLAASCGFTVAGAWGATSPTWTVTYESNSSTSGAAPVDAGKYAAGATVVVKGNTGSLVRTGYTFTGWNTAANGVGTAQAAGSTFVMGSANVILFAQWKLIPTYVVTYTGNGETAGSPPVDAHRYAAGTTVTVKGNGGKLADTWHVFSGWNTAASGAGVSHAAGGTLTMPAHNLTLYADWKPDVLSVWGGAQEAITLRSDGTVWTWGANFNGELGDGETDNQGNGVYVTNYNSPVPLEVLGPDGVGHLNHIVAIMGGEMHNLALKSDGTVWAWGLNAENQLGDGTTTDTTTPVQVSGLSSIVSLGSRAYHSLAIKADGTVWAWGSNRKGELGNGVADPDWDNFVPVLVKGVSDPIMVTSGYEFSLALLQNRTLVAWGGNSAGQLGDGTTNDRYAPVPVVGISDVAWVSAGWGQVVAVKTDGTVWTWGSNAWGGTYSGCGLLGDGKNCTMEPYRTTPGQVQGLSGAYRAWGGDTHTAVLMLDGTVWAFGSNQAGQLGTGAFSTQSLVPVRVRGMSDVIDMTARDFHNQVIKTDGSVWSWGSGLSGELGDGSFVNSPVPVEAKPF